MIYRDRGVPGLPLEHLECVRLAIAIHGCGSGPHPHPPPGPASKNGAFMESSLWDWLVVAVILHQG